MAKLVFLQIKVKFVFISVLTITVFTCCISHSETKQRIISVSQLDSTNVGAAALSKTIQAIKAPFSVKTFSPKNFDNHLNIKNFDAKENILSTQNIQQCIDKASEEGGGIVVIPKGHWKSGRLILKSNVNLHLEEGAILKFSGELKDYQPAVFTRIEGIEVMSLGACIYANDAHDISITGKGKLIGPAKGEVRHYLYDTTVIEKVVPLNKPVKKRKYSGLNGEGYFLPMFISPINCTNVLIEGISLENTAFWNIVPTYCDNVIIRGVNVHSIGIERGDGIDIESSKNVLIEYCTLSCGDDCFTLKAGRGIDGIRVNKPTENVVIRYCLAKEGHGGITCGSETAGMIKNVYVHDCLLENTGVGLRFKTRRPRGGGGKNLTYERIKMNLRYTALKWDMLGSPGSVGALANRFPTLEVNELTPTFSNIKFTDLEITNCSRLIGLIGIPESPVSNININNMKAKCNKLIECYDVTELTIENSLLKSNNDTILLSNTKDCTLKDNLFKSPGSNIIVCADSLTATPINIKDCMSVEFKYCK